MTIAETSEGGSGVDADRVLMSFTEGNLVTIFTDVKTNEQESIRWYFNGILIAQIRGDLSDICTDVQCNEDNERFTDRLEVDHQTGSLTIMNIRTTDSGLYALEIISHNDSNIAKIFSVTVSGESSINRKSVNEGESVTLDAGVMKNPNYVMTWYFNEILVAEITGDQSKICTGEQCEERFRDRLKLDHQTGSLTIMNTRTTDSGLYTLKIISSSNIISHFSVTVIAMETPALALHPTRIAGTVIAVLLLAAAVVAGVFFCRHKTSDQEGQRASLPAPDISSNASSSSSSCEHLNITELCQSHADLQEVLMILCQTSVHLRKAVRMYSMNHLVLMHARINAQACLGCSPGAPRVIFLSDNDTASANTGEGTETVTKTCTATIQTFTG
ncbi:uncharacterized protein LOC131530226 [Onychostoma macrolepis]|uniref:uncharacterized protein LOC131530226 n=1 Tax=Onychostoma macrolepis TaxID=369639 RepID=UPI002729E160|nr:uncharacterized protein LOC131530226 [Onychostoma macrolepis]